MGTCLTTQRMSWMLMTFEKRNTKQKKQKRNTKRKKQKRNTKRKKQKRNTNVFNFVYSAAHAAYCDFGILKKKHKMCK